MRGLLAVSHGFTNVAGVRELMWLGPILLPARFWMREIGDEYVAGVWKDELDVEYVRIYHLSRTGKAERE